MARLNTSQLFQKKRRLSVPVIKLPRNVKEALQVDTARVDGIFRIEPGKGTGIYDRCYIFEDINYISQDDDCKENILLQFMNWLKSMNMQHKITVATEQRDMEQFISEIFRPIHGAEYPELEKGIGQWINQKIDEGPRDINKILYLTITCRAKNFAEAEVYFATLDTTLEMIFSGLGSKLYRMSGLERICVLQRMLRLEPGLTPSKEIFRTDGWKNQVVPGKIQQESDYLIINNRKYVCLMFGHDYDQSIDDEKLIHGLTNNPFPVYVTLDIEPIPKRLLTDKLLVSHTNNERVIARERERNNRNQQFGAGVSYLTSRKKEELEELMDQADENDEGAVYVGMLVMAYADSLEELEQRVDTLCQIAVTNGYTLEPYYERQLKALMTVLPVGGRQVNHMRALFTSSAVAFNPFRARDLQEPGGFVYGVNRTTKRLLIGNRKMLKAPHGIVVAHTGGGKSYLIKEIEVSQGLLCTDDDIIILDPNNEQEEVIRSCGGQYFDFTPQSTIHLNAFEVPESIWKGSASARNIFIAGKTEYANAFCVAAMTNMTVTQVHKTYIGRAVRKMYDMYFQQSDYRKQPTLKKLWELLKVQVKECRDSQEERMLLDIVDSLEEYVTGVYDMLAHPSNLDIHSRLAGFGLKNVPEAIWEPIMVTVMHFLSMRLEYNQQKKVAVRLIVDETQVLCDKGSSAAQLLHAVETFRKVGGIVTLVIQNLTRALENPELRDMFSNCPYKCFMDQGGVDAASLAKIQKLSQTEFRSLNENVVGRGIMVWDKQVYRFDARMSKDNPLYEKFNTDFHEKARINANGNVCLKEDTDNAVQEKILSALDICSMSEEELFSILNLSQVEIVDGIEALHLEGRVTIENNIIKRKNE